MLKHLQSHAILQWTVNSVNLESSRLPGSTIVSRATQADPAVYPPDLVNPSCYSHGFCCKFHWSVSTFLLELATFDRCGLISV